MKPLADENRHENRNHDPRRAADRRPLPLVPHALALSIVEGESGTPVNAFFAPDGEAIHVVSADWASGQQGLSFPHSDHQATYAVSLGSSVVQVRFAPGGVGASSEVCGEVGFSGGVSGTTGVVCTPDDPDRIRSVTIVTTPATGTTFTVTWTPVGTPSSANVVLDCMIAS